MWESSSAVTIVSRWPQVFLSAHKLTGATSQPGGPSRAEADLFMAPVEVLGLLYTMVSYMEKCSAVVSSGKCGSQI